LGENKIYLRKFTIIYTHNYSVFDINEPHQKAAY